MPTETDSILIHATPQDIFDYVANPKNLPKMLASNVTVRVEDVEPLPTGGYRYHWDYNILGVRLAVGADAEVVEFDRPRRFAVRSYGGIETLSAWDLVAEGDRTKATFSIAYEVSQNLLMRLSGGFMEQQIRYSVGVALLKMKELVEGEVKARQKAEQTGQGEAPA